MHLARLEFIGYHVFDADYKNLTPDQALFIDYGVMRVYADLFGSEENEKEMRKIRRMRHR